MDIYSKISVKILRLASLAQDDTVTGTVLLTEADSLKIPLYVLQEHLYRITKPILLKRKEPEL